MWAALEGEGGNGGRYGAAPAGQLVPRAREEVSWEAKDATLCALVPLAPVARTAAAAERELCQALWLVLGGGV